MDKRTYSKELKETFKNGDPERAKILKNIIKFAGQNPQIEHLEFTVVRGESTDSVLRLSLKVFDDKQVTI